MAEIHVQAKKHSTNLTWVWILIALLVIAAIVYYVMRRNKETQQAPAPLSPTQSQLKPQVKPESNKGKIVPVVYMRTV